MKSKLLILLCLLTGSLGAQEIVKEQPDTIIINRMFLSPVEEARFNSEESLKKVNDQNNTIYNKDNNPQTIEQSNSTEPEGKDPQNNIVANNKHITTCVTEAVEVQGSKQDSNKGKKRY